MAYTSNVTESEFSRSFATAVLSEPSRVVFTLCQKLSSVKLFDLPAYTTRQVALPFISWCTIWTGSHSSHLALHLAGTVWQDIMACAKFVDGCLFYAGLKFTSSVGKCHGTRNIALSINHSINGESPRWHLISYAEKCMYMRPIMFIYSIMCGA